MILRINNYQYFQKDKKSVAVYKGITFFPISFIGL